MFMNSQPGGRSSWAEPVYQYQGWQLRGPRCDISKDHIAVLGGAESFGRFMPRPYPVMLGHRTGLGILNLGQRHTGVEAWVANKKFVLAAHRARAVVVELPSLTMMSSGFYKVHPRRNDRVVRVYAPLRRAFPGFETTDIHFVGHLHQTCAARDPLTYAAICAALRETWVEKMQIVLRSFDVPVHLLWFEKLGQPRTHHITADMVQQLTATQVHRIPVRVPLDDFTGLRVPPWDAPVQCCMVGQAPHDAAARRMVDALSSL